MNIRNIIKTSVLFLCGLVFVFAIIVFINHYTKENFIYRSKEPLKIGATYMTLNNPFFNVMDEEIKANVDAHGDVLISLDPALDVNKQIEQIYYLIDQNVNAIIVNPVDFKGLTPALKAAHEANIPIISVDTEFLDDSFVSYSVISDNYDAGVKCAQDMMQKKERADIVLLEHQNAYTAVQRIQGFIDTIATNPNYRVVKRMDCEGQLENAMPLMSAFLDEEIHFDVVMALNDPSALGALAAMQAKNKLDNVMVYGVDASPETKTLISEHIMEASISQSPKDMGNLAIENTYKILNHEDYEKQEKMPVTLISQDNINDYALEGWQ